MADKKFLPIEWHSELKSTNSYLLRKFETTPALADGYAIAALHQTTGRGQRERQWEDEAGKSLLLSVGARPAADLSQLPVYSFGMALTIAEALEMLLPSLKISLKWPNDLYLENRKLGGILIENVLRGMSWMFSVAGVGVNVLQQSFPEAIQHRAVSLRQLCGDRVPALEMIADTVHEKMADFMVQSLSSTLLECYNARLYRQGEKQAFVTDGRCWKGIVEAALPDGRLQVRTTSGVRLCTHGVDEWLLR